MERAARTRLNTLAVLLAVSIPLVIAAASGRGGEDEEDSSLYVERSTEAPELILYVEPEANSPDRAGERGSITVECLDADGAVVVSQSERWPFTDTDEGTLDPHAHVSVNPARIAEVERCRLKGTEPVLEAPVV
jgi:hypothetical protein